MALNLTEYKIQFLQGLADKTRLKIIEALKEREKTVSQLVAEIGSSQSNISGHLKTLRNSGILKSRQEGRYVFYSLCDKIICDFIYDLENLICNISQKSFTF